MTWPSSFAAQHQVAVDMAPRQTPPPVRPLEAVRVALQRELDPRYVQFPSFAHQAGSEPLVVPLGAEDPLGDLVADRYAMVRSRATIHLTGRAVLIGPWGGGPSAGCGLCLGLHWQKLRGGPRWRARAWGHGPLHRNEKPPLTPYATDVVRTVWTAVFGSREPDRPETAGPVRTSTGAGGPAQVTCVDLKVPEPRTHRFLPGPASRLPCGCGG